MLVASRPPRRSSRISDFVFFSLRPDALSGSGARRLRVFPVGVVGVVLMNFVLVAKKAADSAAGLSVSDGRGIIEVDEF